MPMRFLIYVGITALTRLLVGDIDASLKTVLTRLKREMRSPEGAFYATQDADSEGEEGNFFVWSRKEINQILGEEDGEIFTCVYDVT